MNILGTYTNGNYLVCILEDGTKIRYNRLPDLIPTFPESIDMKISNRCDMGCPMCHEQSVPDGALTDLRHPILDSLRPFTELALGGGNVLEHPDLEDFLRRMKARQVICNITVHLDHFIREFGTIASYCEQQLVHGVGISVQRPLRPEEISCIQCFPDAVVHVIAGLIDQKTLESMFDRNIKLLILGYKRYGRGKALIENCPSINTKINELKLSLANITPHFPVISFDNLALQQLDPKRIVDDGVWKLGYMGKDGQFTMYIDLVKQEYAVSSTSPRMPLTQKNIEEVFSSIKQVS